MAPFLGQTGIGSRIRRNGARRFSENLIRTIHVRSQRIAIGQPSLKARISLTAVVQVSSKRHVQNTVFWKVRCFCKLFGHSFDFRAVPLESESEAWERTGKIVLRCIGCSFFFGSLVLFTLDSKRCDKYYPAWAAFLFFTSCGNSFLRLLPIYALHNEYSLTHRALSGEILVHQKFTSGALIEKRAKGKVAELVEVVESTG